MKTRLVPPLTPDDAAFLYRAFLLDAVSLYASLGEDIEPVVYVADAADAGAMREMIEREGEDGRRIDVRAQRGEGLGERLEAAFAEAFDDGCARACAIGTDHPTLPPGHVRSAFAAMSDHDLAIGPADDGGYYLLALAAPAPELFRGMPYSTPDLYNATLGVAVERRMRILRLPEWYDVDDAASLRRLIDDQAMLPPGSRTIDALEQIGRRMTGGIQNSEI